MAIRTEVCVDAVAGARAAATGGADRIELCAALETGGLTPSIGLQEAVADACELPRHVLIRPRQGDFCWDADEIDQMVRDIRAAVAAGAAAAVIGALTSRGEVDIDATARLRDAADGSPVTFNRAFDLVGDQADRPGCTAPTGHPAGPHVGRISHCARRRDQVGRVGPARRGRHHDPGGRRDHARERGRGGADGRCAGDPLLGPASVDPRARCGIGCFAGGRRGPTRAHVGRTRRGHRGRGGRAVRAAAANDRNQ